MTKTSLDIWIQHEAKRRGCNLVGIAELNKVTQREFSGDVLINESPGKFVIVLVMALEDPIQDVWTQAPSWPNGKNYIDEALARVATVLAFKLTQQGYPSRTIKYGSAYLKHLAIHAGLGIIGRNNLLITPQYGPHLRLRALITIAPLKPLKSLTNEFKPCVDCSNPPPCLKACPAGAFKLDKSTPAMGFPRSGYEKEVCRSYSVANLKEIGPFTYLWCRACEESCPIGNINLPK